MSYQQKNKAAHRHKKTTDLHVVVDNQPKPPNVPSRARFVPRDLQDAWMNLWRSRKASMMKLVRSNKPLRLLDVEDAIIDALDRRERKLDSARMQTRYLRRAA